MILHLPVTGIVILVIGACEIFMNKETVSHKTARTAFWSGIEKAVNMGTQFVVTLILARLLLPEDYGAIAMLTVFIGVAERMVESGVSNALIRKMDCSQVDYSTGFYFNLMMSLGLYCVLFFIAPLISDFYNIPILCNVLRVYGVLVIANALTLVQYSMLSKNLEFKKLAKIKSVSVILSGIIGVGCAYYGLGVWALVAQGLSSSVLYAFSMSLNTRWMPSFVFSKESFRYLWNFGSKMLLTGIIGSLYANIYSLVIGKVYDSRSLGLFNRGQYTANVPTGVLESVFIRSSLPILSELQNDNQRLVDVYRKFVVLVAFVSFPICFLLAALATPFVQVVLTDKWIDSVIYIQIFAMSAVVAAPNILNLNLFQVKGRSDITLKAEIIKKSMGVLVVFLLLPFGPLILAIGASIFNIVGYSVNLYYAKKLVGIPFVLQLRDMLPCCVSAILASVVVCFFTAITLPPFIHLFVGGIIGCVIYYCCTKYLYKMEIYNQIFSLIKRRK